MCCKWKKLIKDADREKVHEALKKEPLYDIEVIDQLYIAQLIDREEYIFYLKEIMNNHSTYARLLELIIECVERREDYNPSWHYCCCQEEK